MRNVLLKIVVGVNAVVMFVAVGIEMFLVAFPVWCAKIYFLMNTTELFRGTFHSSGAEGGPIV